MNKNMLKEFCAEMLRSIPLMGYMNAAIAGWPLLLKFLTTGVPYLGLLLLALFILVCLLYHLYAIKDPLVKETGAPKLLGQMFFYNIILIDTLCALDYLLCFKTHLILKPFFTNDYMKTLFLVPLNVFLYRHTKLKARGETPNPRREGSIIASFTLAAVAIALSFDGLLDEFKELKSLLGYGQYIKNPPKGYFYGF